jgi:hypothetical protein
VQAGGAAACWGPDPIRAPEEVPIALAIRVATRATSEQLNSQRLPLAKNSIDQRPRWSQIDGVPIAIDRM